jgi:hypothetical protein
MTSSLASPIARPRLEPVTAALPRAPTGRRGTSSASRQSPRAGSRIRARDAFAIEVEAGQSLAAFNYPNAYAAFRRVSRTEGLVP